MKGLSIASLVLGIVSIVFLFFLPWLGIVCAAVGLVLAIVARSKTPAGDSGRGMATAGMVLCIVALGICIVVTIACVACVASIGSGLNSLL